jgi:hypothetical protein
MSVLERTRKAGLRIRIRIISGRWIRIRIRVKNWVTSILKSKFRSFRGLEWSPGRPRTLRMEAWRLKMESWRNCRPEVADRITLMRSRIRIRIKVKSRIRIRIKIKSWIRIYIKSLKLDPDTHGSDPEKKVGWMLPIYGPLQEILTHILMRDPCCEWTWFLCTMKRNEIKKSII